MTDYCRRQDLVRGDTRFRRRVRSARCAETDTPKVYRVWRMGKRYLLPTD